MKIKVMNENNSYIKMKNNCITIYVLPMNHLSQKLLA
jgi:hypothetical protein